MISELNAEFWVAVAAITIPILFNAWWISMKIITQLKLIARELEGNKEDHVEIKVDLRDAKSVNDAQWVKLVEHRVDLTKHEGRIDKLETQQRSEK